MNESFQLELYKHAPIVQQARIYNQTPREWLGLADPVDVADIRNWVAGLIIKALNNSNPSIEIQRLLEEEFPNLAHFENSTYILRYIHYVCSKYFIVNPIPTIDTSKPIIYRNYLDVCNQIQNLISEYFIKNATDLGDVGRFLLDNPISVYVSPKQDHVLPPWELRSSETTIPNPRYLLAMLSSSACYCASVIVHYGVYTHTEVVQQLESDSSPVLSVFVDGSMVLKPTQNGIWTIIASLFNSGKAINIDHHYGERPLESPATLEMVHKTLVELVSFILQKKSEVQNLDLDLSLIDQIKFLTAGYENTKFTHTDLCIILEMLTGEVTFVANVFDPDTGLAIFLPIILRYLLEIISNESDNLGEYIIALTKRGLNPISEDTVEIALKSENKPELTPLNSEIFLLELSLRSNNPDFVLTTEEEHQIVITTIKYIRSLGSTNVNMEAEEIYTQCTPHYSQITPNSSCDREVSALIEAVRKSRQRTFELLNQIRMKTLAVYNISIIDLTKFTTFNEQIAAYTSAFINSKVYQSWLDDLVECHNNASNLPQNDKLDIFLTVSRHILSNCDLAYKVIGVVDRSNGGGLDGKIMASMLENNQIRIEAGTKSDLGHFLYQSNIDSNVQNSFDGPGTVLIMVSIFNCVDKIHSWLMETMLKFYYKKDAIASQVAILPSLWAIFMFANALIKDGKIDPTEFIFKMKDFYPLNADPQFDTNYVVSMKQNLISKNDMRVISSLETDKKLPTVVILTEIEGFDHMRMWTNALHNKCIIIVEKTPVAGQIFSYYYAISTIDQGGEPELVKLTTWLSLVASFVFGIKVEDTGNIFAGTSSGGTRTIGMFFDRDQLAALIDIYYQIQNDPTQSEELLTNFISTIDFGLPTL